MQTQYVDKEAVLIIFGFALFFGVGGLFHKFSLGMFSVGFLFGAYLGFSALPFFDSKKWRPKPLTCAFLAFLGAMAFALFFRGWSVLSSVYLGLCGLIIGYFAPWWSKYL